MNMRSRRDPRACFIRIHCGRAYRLACAAALLSGIAACRTPPPQVVAPDRAQRPPEAYPDDGSYDWHALLVAPFGSVLKDIPLMLHEVLLFRDEERGSTAADDAECYAADAPALRFVALTPDEYLLCFKQDRLTRIQALVRLPAAEASEVFAAACVRWLENAARSTAAAEAPGAGMSPDVASDAAQSATACEGRDGAIHFSGRLGEEPGAAEPPQAEAALSIILEATP
jgi:hypothetical protein